jgi:hypothetical protein
LQDLHGLIGPFNPLFAEIGKLKTFNIVLQLRGAGYHTSPVALRSG